MKNEPLVGVAQLVEPISMDIHKKALIDLLNSITPIEFLKGCVDWRPTSHIFSLL